MPDPNPALAAASDRLARAFSRLEAALDATQSGRHAAKEERDRFKRSALEEQEKFKSLQAAAYTVSTRLDQSIDEIDAILKA